MDATEINKNTGHSTVTQRVFLPLSTHDDIKGVARYDISQIGTFDANKVDPILEKALGHRHTKPIEVIAYYPYYRIGK